MHNKIFTRFKILKKYISKGDTLYIEIELLKFKELYSYFKNKDKFLIFFLNLFKKLVGKNGNIIFPSFTYSWGSNSKKKSYDILNTKPKTGIFPCYLLKQPGIKRTLDPMFSFLIYGKDKKRLSNIGKDSFGKKSLFEKIHNSKTKLITFGLNRFDPTFVHYVEQYFDENIDKINYRYKKKFIGFFSNNNKKIKNVFFSFVRKENSNFFFTGKNIERDLKKNNKLTILKIFNANIYITQANDFFKFGISGMKKSKKYFIKKK